MAVYRYILKQKKYSKKKTKIRHKKSLVWKKKGPSKLPVLLMQLITNLRISWLKLTEVAYWQPYKKDWHYF